MRMLPVPVAARRMAILLFAVVALDAAAAFFIPKPQIWCAIIPVLIPVLTPALIFTRTAVPKS